MSKCVCSRQADCEAVFIFEIGRLGDRGQRLDHRAIDRHEPRRQRVLAHLAQRPDLRRQFADDLAQERRIEDFGGFRERAQTGPRDFQLALHVAQLGRLLQTAQRADDGIEQKQQDQGAVLIHEQLAVAGPVARSTHRPQAFQERCQALEILQPLNVAFTQRMFSAASLAGIGHVQQSCANPVPNSAGDKLCRDID